MTTNTGYVMTIKKVHPSLTAMMLAGPAVSVAAALAANPAGVGHTFAWVLLAFWLPILPFSLPAMILAPNRELERHHSTNTVQWLKRLYFTGHSTLLSAHWANLLGVLAAAAILASRSGLLP